MNFWKPTNTQRHNSKHVPSSATNSCEQLRNISESIEHDHGRHSSDRPLSSATQDAAAKFAAQYVEMYFKFQCRLRFKTHVPINSEKHWAQYSVGDTPDWTRY